MEQTEKMDKLEEIKHRSKYHLYPQDTKYLISEIERLRKALKFIDKMAENLNNQYPNNAWIYEIAKILHSEAILRNSINKGAVDGGSSLPDI